MYQFLDWDSYIKIATLGLGALHIFVRVTHSSEFDDKEFFMRKTDEEIEEFRQVME